VKKQFRHGERKAVLQAITGASLLRGLPIVTPEMKTTREPEPS
jgi:hypothetical protein